MKAFGSMAGHLLSWNDFSCTLWLLWSSRLPYGGFPWLPCILLSLTPISPLPQISSAFHALWDTWTMNIGERLEKLNEIPQYLCLDCTSISWNPTQVRVAGFSFFVFQYFWPPSSRKSWAFSLGFISLRVKKSNSATVFLWFVCPQT